jgi:hypothetical protein
VVVVCATRWHPDDLIGRIHAEMERDAEFPRFRTFSFPACNADDSYLFPEMYDREWYEAQRLVLGPEMASALLDCNPV